MHCDWRYSQRKYSLSELSLFASFKIVEFWYKYKSITGETIWSITGEMFLPKAMKSSWSQACSWAKGPLYSSSPSAMSVMNSRDTWLSKQGIMGGNQA